MHKSFALGIALLLSLPAFGQSVKDEVRILPSDPNPLTLEYEPPYTTETVDRTILDSTRLPQNPDGGLAELLSNGGEINPVPVVVGSLAVTVGLLVSDQQTYDAISSWKDKSAAVRSISPVVTQLGSGVFSLGLFGGLWIYSSCAHDDSALEAGKLGLESFVLAGIAVQVLKQVFGRERPTAATRPGGTFHGPFSYFSETRGDHKGWTHFDAFPSGHTATAFAAATILSDIYQTAAVTYGSYALATAVGISRITEDTHWASDVFVGALVGYYSAKLVEMLNHGSSHIRVVPFVDERRYGVKLGLNL